MQMSKEKRFYCKIGQAVCNAAKITLLVGLMYGLGTLANTLANLI